MLKGSIVALITPFLSNRVDELALKHLLIGHLERGTQGIVVCGTTGESAALTPEERRTIISITVSTLKDKIPVIVGAGTASFDQTLKNMTEAEHLGADAILVVTPYYVKPSQEGIIEYYKALHQQTTLPILVYNNPYRTSVNIEIETLVELATLPRVIGLKDSHSDATRLARIRRQVGDGFLLFSGEDSVTPSHMLYGADGAISVVGNCVPEVCRRQMDAWFNLDIQTFQKISHDLLPLLNALSLETNPCTIKYAVSSLGSCLPDLRLPLLSPKPETKLAIDRELSKFHNLGKTALFAVNSI